MIKCSDDQYLMKGVLNMKLSQKRVNQITACLQLILVGIMGAFAFEREIRIGNKVTNKLKKKRLKKAAKKAKRKGTAV